MHLWGLSSLRPRQAGWLAVLLHQQAGDSATVESLDVAPWSADRKREKGNTVKKTMFSATAMLGILAFATLRAVAQDPAPQPTTAANSSVEAFTDQQTALLRTKKQLIAANLKLTQTEATKFWPLYEQYSAELGTINDTRTVLLKEYAEEYGSLTNDQADNLIRRWLDTDIAASELRQKYVAIMRGVLSGKTAATFFQLDRRISMMIDLQLTSQLPLVQSQELQNVASQ